MRRAGAASVAPGSHRAHRGEGWHGGEVADSWPAWTWRAPSRLPPWVIPARALGESRELVPDDEEDDEADEDEGSLNEGGTDDDASVRHRTRRGCWAHCVAGVSRFMSQPRKADAEEATVDNAMAPAIAHNVSCRRGTLYILRALLWDIIHPESVFRSLWDFIIVLLLLYVAVVTPYVIGFNVSYAATSWEGIMDLVVNCFFIVDICLNFRTGVRVGEDATSRGYVIRSRRKIAIMYLRGWFALDVLASLPWNWISNALGSYMQLAKVPRLLRLLRLIRLIRVFRLAPALQTSRIMHKMERRQGAAVARVVTYANTALLMLHLSACAWFFTAVMEDPTLENTWVSAYGLADADKMEQYVASIYYIVITFTTVGYGDIYPVTTAERCMTCIGMLIGVVTLGFIVSTANSIWGSANKYELARAEVQSRVEAFLVNRPLPRGLSSRVKGYYNYVCMKQHNEASDDQLVASLPLDLRRDVLRSVHTGLIRRLPFLDACCALQEELVLEVAAALKLELYAHGDTVIMEGGWETEMYFITEGRMAVRQRVGGGSHGGRPLQAQQSGAAAAAAASLGPGTHFSRAASGRPPRPEKAREDDDERATQDGATATTCSTTNVTMDGEEPEEPPGAMPKSAGGTEDRAAATAQLLSGGEARAPGDGDDFDGLMGDFVTDEPSMPAAGAPPADSGGPGTGEPGGAEGHPISPGSSHAHGRQQYSLQWQALLFAHGGDFKHVRTLRPGMFFGEYSCLTGCPRTATVVAKRMSEVFALSRADLVNALSRWPDVHAAWMEYDEYGERERARLRDCFRGAADSALDSSQARYRDFLRTFRLRE